MGRRRESSVAEKVTVWPHRAQFQGFSAPGFEWMERLTGGPHRSVGLTPVEQGGRLWSNNR